MKKVEEKSADEQEKEVLYRKIGRLQTEFDFLKSLGEMNLDLKRQLISRENGPLSIIRQFELLEIHRSGIYFKPKLEKQLNLQLMRLIDEKFMEPPHLGVLRMTTWLRKDMGYMINEKRITRLYRRLMELQTIFQKKI